MTVFSVVQSWSSPSSGFSWCPHLISFSESSHYCWHRKGLSPNWLIHPPDMYRDVTRFPWLKYLDDPTILADNFDELHLARVPLGVISNPFLLAATVQHHLEASGDKVMSQIQRDLYVDDVITGVESPSSAIDLCDKAKSVFRSAGMNLDKVFHEHDLVCFQYLTISILCILTLVLGNASEQL